MLLVDSENDGLLAVNRYVECFETNVNTIYAETLLSHKMVLPFGMHGIPRMLADTFTRYYASVKQ